MFSQSFIPTSCDFVPTSRYINYYTMVGDCVYFHPDFNTDFSRIYRLVKSK